MVIRTIFTCVIRFFRSICAAFLSSSVSTPSMSTTSDVESGLSKTSGVADLGHTLATVEAPSSSFYISVRNPNRKISTVRPVKSRIVDAVLRNVRDKRSSVLKEVVITRSSFILLPYSAKIEAFPGPTPSSRAPISSALKVLKTSGERVVKFVLTPTFLLDADPLPTTSTPARSDHSIEDIIALFPPPPVHVSVERTLCYDEIGVEPNLFSSTKDYRSSLSTIGSLLSVTSVVTAATSPPTTPELDQMTQMTSASNGVDYEAELFKSQCCRPSLIGSSLESVEFAGSVSLQTNCGRKQAILDQYSAYAPSSRTQAVPTSVAVSYLPPWEDGHKKLDSITSSDHFLQESSMVSANASEDLAFSVTQDCLLSVVTSKGQARNPETGLTAIAQADSEPMRKGISSRSVKHVLHAFRNANGEDRLREESCFPGKFRFTILDASTPSSSTDSVAPSCSEGPATSNSVGGTSDMNRSPAPFLCTHGSSSHLGPNVDVHGLHRDQAYGDTIQSFDAQTCNTGNNSPFLTKNGTVFDVKEIRAIVGY